jgi:hypothetical protein
MTSPYYTSYLGLKANLIGQRFRIGLSIAIQRFNTVFNLWLVSSSIAGDGVG